jgi:hypothetical protein
MPNNIYNVAVQVYDETTGELVGDANVRTTADLVFFDDGETFQEKLDAGVLTGPAGATGNTGQRGSRWFSGSGMTGTSTTATIFSGSGVASALVDDLYMNTGTGADRGRLYRCTTAGNAAAAEWVYAGTILGPTGATGNTGAKGADGATGPKGEDGDNIKVGTSYATAVERKIFFKVLN